MYFIMYIYVYNVHNTYNIKNSQPGDFKGRTFCLAKQVLRTHSLGGGLDERGCCFNASNQGCEAVGRKVCASDFIFSSYKLN